MRVGLQIILNESVEYSSHRHFSFVVVDLDKPGGYPGNFVCILPARISDKAKVKTAFMQIFKDKSLEQAKALLKKALKKEEDSDVKAEIERRLSLLEPEPIKQIACSDCGRLFQPRRVRRYSLNFCGECMRKRFGDRG